MTYEELKAANAEIKTTDIKGKAYAEVNERITAFRKLYPEGTIKSEILSLADGIVTMKASVYNGDKLLAVGHAQEKESSTYINKTSFIENCETSAVGRALGMVGIGIDTSIASYEEVQNVINNQQQEKAAPVKTDGSFTPRCTACGKEITVAEHDYSVKKFKTPLCRGCQKSK